MTKTQRKHQAGLKRMESFNSQHSTFEAPLPKRAKKCWMYKRPVLRYDHYCRWLTNVIGLKNHRQFLAMLICLVMIGCIGLAIDICLAVTFFRSACWTDAFLAMVHLGYSFGLLYVATPIFQIHYGLVSRNELAAEWRRNDFQIVTTSTKGENIPVNDLSDDEFNARFNDFVYDKSRNGWDRGFLANCFTFWCTSRCDSDELGEF